MPEPSPPHHASNAPDFRHMTAGDLRQGILTLSGLVRDLGRFERSGKTAVLAEWREGTPGADAAQKVLPSAALVTRLASLPVDIDTRGAGLLGKNLLAEAEALLRKYKSVWRARPGRVFRDIAARGQRAQLRRQEKGWYSAPPFGL